nr:Fic family protein [Clostridium sp.]
MTIKEIAEFHLKFESIHPFQDGNGSIGKFLILKQCIENDIDPLLTMDKDSAKYIKCMNQHVDDLYNFFLGCFQYNLYAS